MKKIMIPLILIFIISTLNSCNSLDEAISKIETDMPTVIAGNYYLNGDKDNAYIQIINDTTMKFVNFDIYYLTDYLVYEGTDYRGKDAEDFMERQNLPNVFNEEIEFEFNITDNFIYVKALSDEDFVLTVNYRMKYENEYTISFMEEIYIRLELVNYSV